MIQFLVLAQGDGRRWQRPDGTLPLGVPKHLVPVDPPEGDRDVVCSVLERTVAQFSAHGAVVVIAPDDPAYRIPFAEVVTLDRPHPSGTSMDKLLATRHLWAEDHRTTILWGDCYYSDQAVELIAACSSTEPHWFRRTGPSSVTGHRWDESFALSFMPEHHETMLELAASLVERVPAERLHIWNLYAAYLGLDPAGFVDQVARTPHQTVIDDWTDDFDSWQEYTTWLGRRSAALQHPKVVVGIPWYDSGEPHRAIAFEWCCKWWDLHGFDVAVAAGTSRSNARNAVAAEAWARGADVVVFADADTVAPHAQVWAAAALAHMTDRYVIAYTDHVRLPQGATPGAAGEVVPHGVAGVAAVSRELYELTGGYDERFVVWGGEDRAFMYAADVLSDRTERIPGQSWHLWHPPAPEAWDRYRSDRAAQIELGRRYKVAAGGGPAVGDLPWVRIAPPDIDAMLAILREPGAPHHQLEVERV